MVIGLILEKKARILHKSSFFFWLPVEHSCFFSVATLNFLSSPLKKVAYKSLDTGAEESLFRGLQAWWCGGNGDNIFVKS